MTRSETAKLWADRLQRFERAQMNVAQFCAAEGISQASFYQWRRRFQPPQNQNTLTTAQFVPVAFGPKSEQCNPPAAQSRTTIELPGGIKICVEVPARAPSVTSGQAQS